MAAAAVWLASDASAFITGVDIPVDGGISAGRPASVSRRMLVDATPAARR